MFDCSRMAKNATHCKAWANQQSKGVKADREHCYIRLPLPQKSADSTDKAWRCLQQRNLHKHAM